MPHYKFTEQAEHDLDAIIEYTLENWGQSQTVKYVGAALAATFGIFRG